MGILHEPNLVISKPHPTDEETEAQRGERVNSNPAQGGEGGSKVLFSLPAGLAGCRQNTCFCSSPLAGQAGLPLTFELELCFPGLEEQQQYGQW